MVFEREPPQGISALSGEIVRRIDTNTRRIRAIEQRLSGTELRIGSLEEKVIEETENLRKSFEQISMNMKNINERLSNLRVEVLKINKDLDRTAKKTEVKELESLLDLYSPIKSKFTTKEEVERIIEERLSKKT